MVNSLIGFTPQERHFRKSLATLLAPVFDLLEGDAVPEAYMYTQLCDKVAELLQSEARRAREVSNNSK